MPKPQPIRLKYEVWCEDDDDGAEIEIYENGVSPVSVTVRGQLPGEGYQRRAALARLFERLAVDFSEPPKRPT